MGNRNRMSRGLFMWAQSGLLLETGIYFNAPNHPHTLHIHQGQHAGSNHDCQPQETRMRFMWTFVDKCGIVYLTGVVVVVVMVVVVVVCMFTLCVCVCVLCVYSKLGQNALGQIVLWTSKKEERSVSLKMYSCMLSVFQGLLFPAEAWFNLLSLEDPGMGKRSSLQYPLPIILLDALYVYFLILGTAL